MEEIYSVQNMEKLFFAHQSVSSKHQQQKDKKASSKHFKA